MGLVLKRKLSRNGEKFWYSFEYGKGRGQRISTGVFTYVRPRNQPEREHNKAILVQLELKKAQLILDYQGSRIWNLPNQHAKENFLSYYEGFVQKNKRKGNRHLEGGLQQFKTFIGKRTIPFQQITSNLCFRFQNHLLEHLSGNRFLQQKTGVPATIDLHPVAQELLRLKRNDLPAHFRKNLRSKEANPFIFQLPTANGAKKILGVWARKAGIPKHLTWHSARLSFSILLQDANVDPATIALLLGHTSTKYVNETYKRQ